MGSSVSQFPFRVSTTGLPPGGVGSCDRSLGIPTAADDTLAPVSTVGSRQLTVMKADLRLPIGAKAPAGLVLIREDRESGMADYVFCVGVTRGHARELTARCRAIHHGPQRSGPTAR